MPKSKSKAFSILKAILTGSPLKELKRQDKLWTIPLVLAGVCVFVGMGAWFIWGLYTNFYELGKVLQKPYLLFFYANLAGFVLLLFTALPLCMSVFFFSRDTRLLITLPVKPVSITLAKLMEIYVFLLPIQLLLQLPAFILYLVKGQGSLYFIAAGILNMVLMPLLPLALSLLLILGIVKFINIFRYKIMLEVIGMLLLVVALLGFQMLVSRFLMNQDMTNLNIMAQLDSQISRITGVFAPFAWIARGYLPDAPLFLAVSLAMYAALTGLMLFLYGRFYLRTYLARCDEAVVRSAKGGVVPAAHSTKPLFGLLKKEFSVLFSNSTFIFETCGELVILPLLLVIYRFTIPADYLNTILESIGGIKELGLVVFAVLLAMSALNTVAASSLSREGGSLMLSLLLPVRGRVQVTAKMLLQLLLFLTAYWMNLVIVYLFFDLPLPDLIYMIPGGAFFIMLTFMVNITPDIKSPHFKWKHPAEAMKQNPNVLIGMGLSVLLLAVFGGLGFLLLKWQVPALVTGILLTVLVGIITLCLFPVFFKMADKAYSGGIEV